MKPRWVLLLVFIFLIILSVTFNQWFPYLYRLLKLNSNIIQGLASLLQIIIWVGAGITFLFGITREIKIQKEKKDNLVTAQNKRNINISGNKNIAISGDGNLVQVQSEKTETEISVLRLAYLSHLYNISNTFVLENINPEISRDELSGLSLKDVFIAPYSNLYKNKSDGGVKVRESRGASFSDRDYNQISILELINQNDRLVILGDPGSGKSTFINYLTLSFCGSIVNKEPNMRTLERRYQEKTKKHPRSEDKDITWIHGPLIPIKITLRDFAAKCLPCTKEEAKCKLLWKYLQSELDASELGDFSSYLREELLEVGGILLLDGLDEVSEANQNRALLKAIIEDFKASIQNISIFYFSSLDSII